MSNKGSLKFVVNCINLLMCASFISQCSIVATQSFNLWLIIFSGVTWSFEHLSQCKEGDGRDERKEMDSIGKQLYLLLYIRRYMIEVLKEFVHGCSCPVARTWQRHGSLHNLYFNIQFLKLTPYFFKHKADTIWQTYLLSV